MIKDSSLKEHEVVGRKVEECELFFTLPYDSSVELVEDGQNIPVTAENMLIYADKLVEYYVGKQTVAAIKAFKQGFNRVFPIEKLECFTSNELEQKICGAAVEEWKFIDLENNIEAQNGFTKNSNTFKYLLEVMLNLNKEEKRQFLQFCTGSSRLPLGGFAGLQPKFTVNRTLLTEEKLADDYLPTVTTCLNYMKMPEYSNLQALEKKLKEAMYEGSNEFNLT